MQKSLVAVMVGAGLVSLSVPALAQQHGGHETKVEIEVHGAFGFGFRTADVGDGFGLGVRVGIPLIANGPIRSINNSLALGLGADVLFWSGYSNRSLVDVTTLVLPVALQWNFYLVPSFSIFPELGVAFASGGCAGCTFGAWPGLAVGGRVHFHADSGYPAFTFRIGFPVGLTLGVSF